MAENKTKPTEQSVDDFLNHVAEPMRSDSVELKNLMQEISGEKPVMWGSIVGFGTFRYKYASGREGDWMMIGFSPRKAALTLYLGYDVEKFTDELSRLGRFAHGKGCLYVKQLADVDKDALRSLIRRAYEQ